MKRPEDREQRIHEHHAAVVPMIPANAFLIKLSAAVQPKLVYCSKSCDDANLTAPVRIYQASADVALQNTGVISAAQLGRLAVRTDSPPFFFRAGRRLCRRWMVRQCSCSTSTVDSTRAAAICTSTTK